MALNATDLAQKIHDDMGFPGSVSSQLTGWAQAVIEELTGGVVINASGTITGTCPSAGGALVDGAGSNGVISGLSASNMATLIANYAGYGSTSSELSQFCTEIVDHFTNIGTVSFTAGDVVGTCTNTPSSPGTLVNGAGTNGAIDNLNGTTLATAIHNSVYSAFAGPSSKLIEFCTAFTDYIMDNAEVEYAAGDITGTCPSGGGALSNGAGINGTIT